MRRIGALIAVIAILLAAIQLPAYAKADVLQKDSVVLSVDSISSNPDTDVEVAVRISGAYEANILQLSIGYDTNLLQLTEEPSAGFVWNAIESDNGFVAVNTERSGTISFVAILPQGNFNQNGTVLSISFHVSESAEAGSSIPLTLNIVQFSFDELDGTSNAIPHTVQDGSVNILTPKTMTATVIAGSGEGEPDGEIEIPISIEGDYEANVLNLSIAYDSSTIELVGDPTAGVIWNEIEAGSGYVLTNMSEEGKVCFVAISPQETFSESGMLFSLRFKVSNNALAGTNSPINVSVSQFSYDKLDGSSVSIDFEISNGGITVVEPDVPTYTVTYNINGEFYAEQTYEYGAAVTAPEYTVPEGHTFSGWNVPETMPAENLVLNATLTLNSYTITYNVNGEFYAEQTYEYGAAVTAPEYTVPEGYTFSGWNVPETMPAENLVLNATLTLNCYTITYNINGEFYAEQTYEYGATVTAPEYTVPEGHTFSGWNVPETMPADNLVLNATLAVITYEVTFVDGVTGNIIAVITVEHGNDAVAPEAPEHEGYIFDSWNGEYTNVTTDLTITAEYLLIGDVNGDGIVNTVDAVLILRYSMGLINIEFDTRSIDINGDGIVDISDAILILRIAMNG